MAKIKIDFEACKGCGICVHFCPKESIAISKDLNTKGYNPANPGENQEKCTGCAICMLVCPDMAIEVTRDE